jgi:hypothetical protein
LYPQPERLFHGGTILLDPVSGETTDALLLGADRVLAAGAEARAAAGRAVGIDLGGRFLQPGFIDAHTHLPEFGQWLTYPDLSGVASLAELLEVVRAEGGKPPDDEWLVLNAWDETGWPEGRMPERADLDRACPVRPVLAMRVDMHMGVVNTPGLERLGRDPAVHPAGHLVEDPFFAACEAVTPGFERRLEMLETAVRACHAEGVTSVHSTLSAGDLGLLQAARDRGRLGVRVAGYLRVGALDALEALGLGAGFGDDRLRLAGLKVFLDGSVGARTAAFRDPYADAPDRAGELLYSPAELRRLMRRCAGLGLQPALHCIGDRAVAAALTAFTEGAVGPALRPRLEHCEFFAEADAVAMAERGAVASCQPNFVGEWGGPDGLYEHRLGRERAAAGNAYARLREAGVALAFGSDHMPFGPRYGLASAIAAPHPGQRLAPDQALAAYTAGAAYAAFEEGERGHLRPGALADVAVLRADPRRPEARPTDIAVDLTVAGGRVVHDPLGLAAVDDGGAHAAIR